MAKFNLCGLAPEIRVMIYPEALAQGFGDALPPLLLALQENQDMYDEAYEVYLKISYTLTLHNCEEFRKIPRKAMMEMRHLKMIRVKEDRG
jgi:hypothetical protein